MIKVGTEVTVRSMNCCVQYARTLWTLRIGLISEEEPDTPGQGTGLAPHAQTLHSDHSWSHTVTNGHPFSLVVMLTSGHPFSLVGDQ